MSWVVANAQEPTRYRTVQQGMPAWTDNTDDALQFARRRDAELWAEEDEDAWRVLEIAGGI